MSWLPAPKTLWGLVTSQESRLQSAPTLYKLQNSLARDMLIFDYLDLNVK